MVSPEALAPLLNLATLMYLASLLFLAYRSRQVPELEANGLRLLGVQVLVLALSLFALFQTAVAIEFVSPRNTFRASLWDSLFSLLLVFVCTALFALSDAVLGLPNMRKRISSPLRSRLLALPAWGATAAAFLSLCIAAPLVDEFAPSWLHLLALALTLLLLAVSILSSDAAVRRPVRPSILLRFCRKAAGGMFLLGARFIPLVGAAVWNADLLQTFVLVIGVALYFTSLVVWLAGGEATKVVVFLRRFGKTELNRTLGKAMRSPQCGVRFRLVTLDDGDFAPVGGDKGPTVASVLGAAVAAAPVAVAMSVALVLFSELFGEAEARLYGQSLVIGLTMLLATVLLCLLPTMAILGMTLWCSWTDKRVSIATSTDVTRLSRIFGPRPAKWARARALGSPSMAVVTTAHKHWQQAVLELMAVADIVLIDLSDPSESVQWELDRVHESFAAKGVILLPAASAIPVEFATSAIDKMLIVRYRSYPDLANRLQEVLCDKALAQVTEPCASNRPKTDVRR